MEYTNSSAISLELSIYYNIRMVLCKPQFLIFLGMPDGYILP